MADDDESYSNLYVLDKDLKQVGAVEELAKSEQIYSVRFMQGRANMVTFRQVDPLFVIDLKDPKNPTVLGELKVPGFSSYLHPYDETRLIGFGKQADDSGRTTGLKLSLFDVSNVDDLRNSHKKWVEEILKTQNYVRESKWSQSIAVGSKKFVESIKEKLSIRAKGRKVAGSKDLYHLREAQAAYNSDFAPENGVLSAKNNYFWNVNS